MLSPFLNAQNKYPDFRRACGQVLGPNVYLNWSPLTDTCNGFQELRIYGRTDTLQPFSFIDSITDITKTQYTHFGAKNISTNWNYRLVYKLLCNGDSAYSRALNIDVTQPIDSYIDSASVDINTGKVVIGWSKNTTPDLMSYVIWRTVGVNNIQLDTIDTTVYVHQTSNPNAGPEGYTLTALDSCQNQSVIQTTHQTMFLQHNYSFCANSITINWSAYVGWNNILSYDILGRINSNSFSQFANNTPANRTYTFTNFIPGDTLEFYIRAHDGDNGYTSSSNKITVITRARKYSNRNYLSYATVKDSSSIELKLLADSASDTKQYTVYRRIEEQNFQKITDINYDGISPSVIYTDNSAEPYKTSYIYRFISKDTCGNNLDTSNTAKTIYLSLSTDKIGNNLKWNRYRYWNAGVNEYKVYRAFDFGSGFTWNTISPILNTDSLYSDSNLPIDQGIAGICYYIEAEENNGNVYGEQATSLSNVVCLIDDAVIHFPNAFAPEKVNTLFLPKGVNIDYNRTNMLIYARNGQLVKKIDDIRNGWDGTNLDGTPCLEGVYLYICELFGINEKKYNFKGTVHLLR